MNLLYLSLPCSILLFGCASIPEQRPPSFHLDLPPLFKNSVTVERLRTGDFLYNSPPYVKKADHPTTSVYGFWGSGAALSNRNHSWSVTVSLADPSKVINAYRTARNGEEANVDEEGNYMFARYEKKAFRWGKGFSYLTQFTQGANMYVPQNGRLNYEVWGFTNDHRYVVHGRFSVTHPRLADSSNVREARTTEDLMNDPDYKLIESCDPNEFSPALPEIDAVMDSLRL